MSKNAIVVGIGGGSGAGKSTFAKLLAERLGATNTALLSYDSYYKTPDSKPTGPSHNYDHPDALDSSLCVLQLRQLKSGQAISVPVYDFEQHVRTKQCITLNPAAVIILEGILVLTEPRILQELDLKIYVEAPESLRIDRRIQRDTSERGRSREAVLNQFTSTVQPMHREYVEPSKQAADVLIHGAEFNTEQTELVLEKIHSLLLNL